MQFKAATLTIILLPLALALPTPVQPIHPSLAPKNYADMILKKPKDAYTHTESLTETDIKARQGIDAVIGGLVSTAINTVDTVPGGPALGSTLGSMTGGVWGTSSGPTSSGGSGKSQ